MCSIDANPGFQRISLHIFCIVSFYLEDTAGSNQMPVVMAILTKLWRPQLSSEVELTLWIH